MTKKKNAVKVIKSFGNYTLVSARNASFIEKGEAVGVVDLMGKKAMWRGGVKIGGKIHEFEFDITDRKAAGTVAQKINALHASSQTKKLNKIFRENECNPLPSDYNDALIGMAPGGPVVYDAGDVFEVFYSIARRGQVRQKAEGTPEELDEEIFAMFSESEKIAGVLLINKIEDLL